MNWAFGSTSSKAIIFNFDMLVVNSDRSTALARKILKYSKGWA